MANRSVAAGRQAADDRVGVSVSVAAELMAAIGDRGVSPTRATLSARGGSVKRRGACPPARPGCTPPASGSRFRRGHDKATLASAPQFCSGLLSFDARYWSGFYSSSDVTTRLDGGLAEPPELADWGAAQYAFKKLHPAEHRVLVRLWIDDTTVADARKYARKVLQNLIDLAKSDSGWRRVHFATGIVIALLTPLGVSTIGHTSSSYRPHQLVLSAKRWQPLRCGLWLAIWIFQSVRCGVPQLTV